MQPANTAILWSPMLAEADPQGASVLYHVRNPTSTASSSSSSSAEGDCERCSVSTLSSFSMWAMLCGWEEEEHPSHENLLRLEWPGNQYRR